MTNHRDSSRITSEALAILPTQSKSIGSIVSETNNLTHDQVESVLAHQKLTGQRFGEAAVAMGLLKPKDVLWALSQQFRYPYVLPDSSSVCAELITARDPFSAVSEAFRDIRSQVLQTSSELGQGRRALSIVSPSSGDGRTFFAANLAVTFSQLGSRTVLVDADMRNPGQHRMFNLETDTGLSSVLAGRGEANVIKPIREFENLFVLPVGIVPPNPLELVQGRAFSQLMLDLALRFDQVIVDTPSFTRSADAKVIARQCGEALIVARPGVSRMADLQQISSILNKPTFLTHGVVTNKY